MNILVTGATGFIGRFLIQQFSERHKIYALCRNDHDQLIQAKNINYIVADLKDPNFCNLLPKNIDVVIHLAQSENYRLFPEKADDIFQVNVNAVLKLLDWARVNAVQHFIYTSSANIYQQQPFAIQENAPLSSSSFYASSKRMAEDLINQFSTYFNTTILRLFTVFGPNQTNMLIPNLIHKISTGQPVQIYGDTGIYLSPIYIKDLVQVFERILHAKSGDLYNVGGVKKVSILELAKLIANSLDVELNLEYCKSPQVKHIGWVADNTKLFRDFGTIEMADLATSLHETIAGTIQAEALAFQCT